MSNQVDCFYKYPSQEAQVSAGGISKKAKRTKKNGEKKPVEYEPDTYFEPLSIVDALDTDDKEIWVWVRHMKNPKGNKLKRNRVPVDEGTDGRVKSRVAAVYSDSPLVVEDLLRKPKNLLLAPKVKKHLEEQSGKYIKDEYGESTKIRFTFKERPGLTSLVDEAEQKMRDEEKAAELARAEVSSVCSPNSFVCSYFSVLGTIDQSHPQF
jgi:hypothetical protein